MHLKYSYGGELGSNTFGLCGPGLCESNGPKDIRKKYLFFKNSRNLHIVKRIPMTLMLKRLKQDCEFESD